MKRRAQLGTAAVVVVATLLPGGASLASPTDDAELPSTAQPTELVGDIDGDGVDDTVSMHPTTEDIGMIWATPSSGGGVLYELAVPGFAYASGPPTLLALVDINDDGRDEMVVYHGTLDTGLRLATLVQFDGERLIEVNEESARLQLVWGYEAASDTLFSVSCDDVDPARPGRELVRGHVAPDDDGDGMQYLLYHGKQLTPDGRLLAPGVSGSEWVPQPDDPIHSSFHCENFAAPAVAA